MQKQDIARPQVYFAMDGAEATLELKDEIHYMLKINGVEADIAHDEKQQLLEVKIAREDLDHPVKISSNRRGTAESYLKGCGLIQGLSEVGPASDQDRIRSYTKQFSNAKEASEAFKKVTEIFDPLMYLGLKNPPTITLKENILRIELSDAAASKHVRFNTNHMLAEEYLLQRNFVRAKSYNDYAAQTLENPNDKYRTKEEFKGIELFHTYGSNIDAIEAKEYLEGICKDNSVNAKIMRRGNKLHIGMAASAKNFIISGFNASFETYLIKELKFEKSPVKGINYMSKEWNQR